MRIRRLLPGLVLLAHPAFVFAQTPPPPPKHEGTAEVAFVGVTGNASTQTYGLGGETTSRPGPWLFRQRVAFVRTESDGDVTAQSFVYTPRAERTLNARLSAFGEYAYFRNRFAGIDARNTVTGGLSVKLVKTDRHALSADGGFGYLNESRLAGDDVSSASYTAGARYVWTLSDTAELTEDLLLIGTTELAADWRLAQAFSVTAALTPTVSLKVSTGVRYLHSPAPGFKTTDTVTSIALVAKFKRN